MQRRTGLALTDVLTALLLAVALIALMSVLLGSQVGVRGASQRAVDGQRLKQIYGGVVQEMHYFTPGGIARKPTTIDGSMQFLPGRGEPDASQNTTANLYSALIMQNYVWPRTVISPLERSRVVGPIRQYDYDIYDPLLNIYWDPAFKADLQKQSHASYAHLVLRGERMNRYWQNTQSPDAPILSHRGPADGICNGKSLTCDSHGNWAGHVVFADGSVHWLAAMTPPGLTYDCAEGDQAADNIFALESGWPGADFILSFTLENGGDTPVIQHD